MLNKTKSCVGIAIRKDQKNKELTKNQQEFLLLASKSYI
jgi:hypothetical protein